MNHRYSLLYEHVHSGVVKLRDGLIVYANPAASSIAGCVVGRPFTEPLIDRMGRAAESRLVELPLRFNVASASGTPVLQVVVVDDPEGGSGVLVMLDRAPQFATMEASLASFTSQVAAEIGPPVEQLVADLQHSAAGICRGICNGTGNRNSDGNGASDLRARRSVHHLHLALVKIEDLMQLLLRQRTGPAERMLLADLVRTAASNLQPTAGDSATVIRLSGLLGNARTGRPRSRQDSPAVYGHRKWLLKAISEYLEHLVSVAPAGSVVDVALQAAGTRAQLRGRLVSAGAADRQAGRPVEIDSITRTAFPTPAAQGAAVPGAAVPGAPVPGAAVAGAVFAGAEVSGPAVTGRPAASPVASNASTATSASKPTRIAIGMQAGISSLGLALCQRIALEHGGAVRIEEEFGLAEIVMELPAGAPFEVDAQLSVEQAARFAGSVSDLRAHQRSKQPNLR